MNRFVNAAPISYEPEVDRAQWRQQPSFDAGLFLDLTNRCVFCALPCLNVPLRERSQEATTAISTADEGGQWDSRGSVKDQTAGAGLLHPLEAAGGGHACQNNFNRGSCPAAARVI